MEFEQRYVAGRPFVRAFVAGSGPPVVLMQFFRSSTLEHYAEVVPALLVGGFSVVAVDPRGIGSNEGNLQGVSFHDLAADVNAVIDVFDLGRVHVIAHAYAALVARCLASVRPALVRSLCLISPGAIGKPFPYPPSEEVLAIYSRIFFGGGLESRERLEAIQSATYSSRSGIAARQEDYGVTAEQAVALLAAAQATPVEDYWKGGIAPILVLQGEDDRICAPANSRALVAELGARLALVEIPRAGHMLTREQPESFEHVVRFLRSIDGGP